MTIAARNDLIARILEREGGVADVGDGMGITRWGQTPGWLATFNLPAPVSADEAAQNYYAWLHLTGLDAVIGDVADNAADFLIDFAVHSGHVTAIRALQRVLDVPADGRIGPVTTAALLAVQRDWLAYAVLAAKMRYEGSAITNHPERHAKFAKGWANREADKLMLLAPPQFA